jgi:predicted alpha/beta hydrolase family esterase
MKTAIIIHGTEGYPEENWFPWLKAELEKLGYRVFVPQFPSPPVVPAKIAEWFEVFKDFEDYLDEDALLIGHSLGGVFALRLLERLNHPVKAVFLVGTPVGVRPILNYERDSSFSGFSFDWEAIVKKARHFEVFQSDNDPYVSLGNGEALAKRLKVKLTFVSKAGHFNEAAGYTEFPLLLQKIKNLL